MAFNPEQIRNRLQQRLSEIRSKVSTGGIGRGQFGQQLLGQPILGKLGLKQLGLKQLGQGQLLNRARSQVQAVMRRSPLMSKVSTRPGGRILTGAGRGGLLRHDLTSRPPPATRTGRESSIADEPAYPANGREIVIEA